MCVLCRKGFNVAGGSCGEKGFPAAKGWNGVTGLGTPNYKCLSKALLSF